MKKSDKVKIYEAPITLEKLEGIATIVSEPQHTNNGFDKNGQRLYRANVRFDHFRGVYSRVFSERVSSDTPELNNLKRRLKREEDKLKVTNDLDEKYKIKSTISTIKLKINKITNEIITKKWFALAQWKRDPIA